MASAEHKALVERLMNAFNAKDFDTIEELFAPEFFNHNPAPFPGMTPDRAGQVRTIRGFGEAVPDGRVELKNLVSEGDMVVFHDVVRGTNEGDFFGIPASGNRIEVEFIHIFRIADGKFAERWGLVDGMTMMRQMGVLPEMAGAAGR